MLTKNAKKYTESKKREYREKEGLNNCEDLQEHFYQRTRAQSNQIQDAEKNIESVIKDW
ncbi:hypothetical protein KAJ87_04040 [Candidatus Pacearchaeota archaeon]|nr:hypothetical protein [Candidatus Pacearchaeota archaeon]